MTQCQSVSTFQSEVRNSLSTLEPCSADCLGHQHHANKLSPKIALHFKVLCESKATLLYFFCTMYIKIRTKSLVFSHIRERRLCSTTRNIGQGKSILNTFPLVFLVKIVCKYTFQCRKCVSWTKLHHVINL